MQTILYSFVWLVDRIRSFFGMIFPIFAEASDFRSWPKWLKVTIHLIVLGVILWLLWMANRFDFVKNFMWKNVSSTFIDFYLPILFLLFYALMWIGYFWWKIFNSEDSAEYEDISIAWDDVTQKLNASKIDINEVPLFLVLGRPANGDDTLFQACGQKIEMRAPEKSISPIRVYAGPNAIYVACSGASTWGRFCERLSNPDDISYETADEGIDGGKTITPDKALAGVDANLQEEFYALLRLQSEGSLSEAEKARLQEIGEQIAKSKSTKAKKVQLTSDEITTGPKRLAYLCRLIAESRRPLCPLNGVLVLAPWSSLDSDETSRLGVGIISSDLATIRKTIKQRYPHFMMVCDLEESSGFEEFRKGFPKEMLKARLGQRLPMVPDRPAIEMPVVLEAAADWIRQNVLATWILKYLRFEWPPEQRKTTQFVPTYNRKLFTFLHDIYERGPRLGRIMSRGFPVESEKNNSEPAASLPLIVGCYLAATGKDEKKQAFIPGVFQRLTEMQSSVSWSDEAVSEDRKKLFWSTLMFVLSLAMLLIAGVLGYILYRDYTASGG